MGFYSTKTDCSLQLTQIKNSLCKRHKSLICICLFIPLSLYLRTDVLKHRTSGLILNGLIKINGDLNL